MKRMGKWYIINGYRFSFIKTKEGFKVFYKGRVFSVGDRHKLEHTRTEKYDEEIRSPMTGKVVSIKVKEGDKVDKDQPLAVIEAMKMEIILTSPKVAKVLKIFVKEGEIINKDDLIIKLSFEED